jgi:multiple sugar transport system permease protein
VSNVHRSNRPSITGFALAILFLFPLVFTGVDSLHGRAGSAQASGFGFDNYSKIGHYGEGLARYTFNTAVVSSIAVVGTLVVATLGGYAFARFTFPGRNLLFLGTLAILMVPYATILIPLYVVLGHIGLQDSLVGVALVLIVFQLPFSVFMMRNSFEALPRELEEAALVDGCSSFGALRRILLHGVRPALITVGLFAFLASWNDFFTPLILLSDGAKFTLPIAVVGIREQAFGVTDYGALEAGVTVMALPCVALFLVLQRHYVQGFTTGAVR